MAHFAQLDGNNIVINVIVLDNQDCRDEHGNESEQVGIQFCKTLFGEDTNWVQTNYNSRIRKVYAGIGFTYDPVADVFVPPQPFPSWLFNNNNWQWEPPIPDPQDGNLYLWDENTISWSVVPEQTVV